jgi:hypothetical protein
MGGGGGNDGATTCNLAAMLAALKSVPLPTARHSSPSRHSTRSCPDTASSPVRLKRGTPMPTWLRFGFGFGLELGLGLGLG